MKAWQQFKDYLAPAAVDFDTAMQQPRRLQERVLAEILGLAESTEYGQRHGFGWLQSVADFQKNVPVTGYEEIETDVSRIAAGERNVLAPGLPVAFELTSGTTGHAKCIPITATGLSAIQRALYSWLHDLIEARPGIASGRSWWILSSPVDNRRSSPGGIPIGMPDDSAWFGAEAAAMLTELLVPSRVECQSTDWQMGAVCALLMASDLTLLSIWSPVTLLALLGYMQSEYGRIARYLETLNVDSNRRRAIRTALASDPVDTQRLWPQLDTISCWADANSAPGAVAVQDCFPHAWIQGKGLLSTEAVVSVPLVKCAGAVPALTSTFIEFEDNVGTCRLCDDLEAGSDYALLVTTFNGLYRYRTGDRVRVAGHYDGVPLLKFVGRDGVVADICGEKLTDAFVLSCLPARRGFMALAPDDNANRRYLLLVDEKECDAENAANHAMQVEQAMQRNPQYRVARRMGQLSAVAPRRIRSPERRYIATQTASGAMQGVIKLPVLFTDRAWPAAFEGEPQ